ncbi:MAG TPA: tRNA (adenosine(37)-N6)-threonylcarbamoyltransferase complex transferase subunit TsaD [Smithella sp.]|nr:tRNA (adenosine(37)-N6)-threonylcarbamoyltransferase complex transferase subunit TsaD [Smithella sp.]HOG89738.1 tRNA (adenosine(37)-N6)-threonylcarbamoyltransferase complex transferase subunit TsaD [Smithella sp.]HOU49983.1 tRNA (adenosine(37)-N6)-threonylcarbamoyltransferase complex transferase subunit TsaD [Smithella sp.]HQG66262.1 tRNA (adenosine(37)-N6)-threonylcarbamoyltransferase complex transferase subunit TsaD [Smithella sp.]HQH17655.1 tRNA (adenosine(37)-N6)-threonylcarbamoyltransfe
MIVLGIESSCDETAAAVINNGKICSNIIASQIAVHSPYGGVVPEIASRKHMEAIYPVITEALNEADITLRQVEGIAVTCGPGLIGSLLIGLSTAKTLAFALDIPFVGVNHLEGHIAAAFLSGKIPEIPFIALVVSGGHTSIYLVKNFDEYQLIGQTRDDAAGEAFDKAAKLLNLGYPGGVVIDRLARNGNPRAVAFPRAMKDSLDFSFSGLKTSLLTMLKKRGCDFQDSELPDIVASYQEAIVDTLVEKTIRAAEENTVPRIVVCGGVAANSSLRERILRETAAKQIELFIPPTILCTDNAAMIAARGEMMLKNGLRSKLDLNAVSRWPLS